MACSYSVRCHIDDGVIFTFQVKHNSRHIATGCAFKHQCGYIGLAHTLYTRDDEALAKQHVHMGIKACQLPYFSEIAE